MTEMDEPLTNFTTESESRAVADTVNQKSMPCGDAENFTLKRGRACPPICTYWGDVAGLKDFLPRCGRLFASKLRLH